MGRFEVLSYQRLLIDRLRDLPLGSLCRWSDLRVRLDDVYVERALAGLFGDASAPLAAPSASGTLREAVRADGAHVVLAGDAGSGKSACLAMLALGCVARALGEAAGDLRGASLPDPAPLPLLLPAREIAPAIAADRDAVDALWEAVEQWLRQRALAGLAPELRSVVERGGGLVLADGLDDLPDGAERRAFVGALAELAARFPENRYVVAIRRPGADLLAALGGFACYGLPPLDRARADALVERWYAALAERAEPAHGSMHERLAELRGALHGDARLADLARAPLPLVLCVLAHAEGYALPADRAVVLGRLARVLSGAAQHEASAPGWLAALGWAFAERAATAGERQPTLARSEVEQALRAGSAGAEIGATVERCVRHGLLLPAEPGGFALSSPHVRPALAGEALAARPDFPERAYALRRDPTWREALLLAQHGLSGPAAPDAGARLVRALLYGPEGDRPGDTADLLLAAECLADRGERADSQPSLQVAARERLAALICDDSTALADRVRAGLLLGRLGDPRFDVLSPPLAHVAAGPWILGASGEYEDEGPARWIDLPDFAIGIHPVSNQQYTAFLREHPAIQRPHYWHDPRFNNPACPVVGVTWHEAMAYCAWLGGRLARAGQLAPGVVVRLPTEPEWEKAASWDPRRRSKRRYPWGDEWDPARANTAERRGQWYTSPAGCYPGGASPYGLHDCLGNVWEWTASIYASYPGAAAPFREEGNYTLRGSSCASSPTHARCTYRSRLPSGQWRYHLGFRIAIGRSLSRDVRE